MEGNTEANVGPQLSRREVCAAFYDVCNIPQSQRPSAEQDEQNLSEIYITADVRTAISEDAQSAPTARAYATVRLSELYGEGGYHVYFNDIGQSGYVKSPEGYREALRLAADTIYKLKQRGIPVIRFSVQGAYDNSAEMKQDIQQILETMS